ncbi:MAG: mycofactocin biosynthesis glycosyltransferase MftF [Actinomycetota bacterium]|nr:mycofactocin biosynthesis glycosyltransferase MftF [Actinomycetota bacterium]
MSSTPGHPHAPATGLRVRLDPTWRRPAGPPADGKVVIAGSPLRLFRLSTGGAHVIALAETGEVPDTPAIRQLIDRFIDAGALHPTPAHGPFAPADVTVVMPTFERVPAALGTPALAGLRTIVVDDASPVPAPVSGGAGVVRRATNGGPSAARNTGLAQVATPLVAFIDADVRLPDGWLAPLLAHFADPRVALVAPRVMGAPGPGVLAGHEQRHSPLDLGDQPARIAAGTRVSYVPAAVLVCRTEAVRALGGFDEGMRLGEDVDLVWRLAEADHRCRYEPAVVAHHEARHTVLGWVRQRMGYGRSAATLARRHPGALAPVRMSGWSVLVWALALSRRPLLALGVAAGTIVALQRKLADVPPREAARMAGLGHLAAGRQLAQATTRVWWPVALVAAACCRRARLPVLAAFTVPVLADAVRTRSLRPLLDAPLLFVDQAAYGAGVWAGVVAEGEPGPLLPDVRNWPARAGR